MVNLLGYEHSTSDYTAMRQQLAAIPHAQVHWYGKTESRPGRKLGHVTVLLEELGEPQRERAIAEAVEAIWYGKER
jgi:5-(carboxyamino)imidazole ribonucleotide synthase